MTIYNGDCAEILKTIKGDICIVTDPPFNIGYHYDGYKDNKTEDEYYKWLINILTGNGFPFVLIHYPEAIYKVCSLTGKVPEKVVSWVYNSNTAKQHRDIAFFGVKPDFRKVRQPYKNPNDKRIRERIEKGAGGGDYMTGGTSTKLKTLVRKTMPILALCR